MDSRDAMISKPLWSTACLDWADRIKTGRSIIPPPIFPQEAAAALEVFKELRLVDVPGSPRIGDSCAQWVFDLAGAIFGSYDSETGRSLIREVLVLVSKKNSKSSIAGALMLTNLIRGWRKSAQMVILSPTTEIATNSFSPARDMVANNEELTALIQTQTHIRTLTNRNTGATLKVLAADSNTVGGAKASFVLCDELWLMGKMPYAGNMLTEATGGLASRPEGQVIYLTTQSDEPPSGVFKQKLDYARDVRDGKIHDPAFLPVLYEMPPDMLADGTAMLAKNLWMTNPNLGWSVDQEFIDREYKKAENAGPEVFRTWLAKHANIELGMNLRSNCWPGAEYWPDCKYSLPVTLERLLSDCEVITIGVDAGGLSDLAAIAVLGRIKNTQNWLLWTKAYAHPSVLERHKQIASRLQDFARDGDLVLVDRIGQDVESIADVCSQVYASGLLDRIGVDPAGIGSILEAIDAQEIPADRVIGISQGWRLNSAIKTTERKLAEGGLLHGGSAMMNWCAGNARVEARGNAILITKQSSGAGKIDPLIASFCAVSLMALNPQSAGESYQMFVL